MHLLQQVSRYCQVSPATCVQSSRFCPSPVYERYSQLIVAYIDEQHSEESLPFTPGSNSTVLRQSFGQQSTATEKISIQYYRLRDKLVLLLTENLRLYWQHVYLASHPQQATYSYQQSCDAPKRGTGHKMSPQRICPPPDWHRTLPPLHLPCQPPSRLSHSGFFQHPFRHTRLRLK